MSKLLARIMLAMLMLPVAIVLYVTVIVFAEFGVRMDENIGFLLADSITAAFIAAYWIRLWRKHIRWTSTRMAATAVVGIVSLAIGVFIGVVGGAAVESSFGVFLGGVTTILCFLIGSIIVWRETPEERAARLRSSGGHEVITCPVCGYNMTGLRESTCPECGGRFTLEELLASQGSREPDELERV